VNPWGLTDDQRRQGRSALVQSLASLAFGAAGPLAAWAVQYLYDRRDLIFNRYGAPSRAFDATGQALNLSIVGRQSALRPGTITVHTGLTNAVRQLGLRDGDPVTLLLVGQPSVRSASGLVVPALVGDQVELAFPLGTYSLAVFASRRDTLFAAPDPFQAVTGQTVTLGRRQTLALPLTPRQPTTMTRFATPSPLALPPAPKAPPQARCACPACTRPGPVDYQSADPRCWACGHPESTCGCVAGSIRRWWRGD